MSRYFVTSSGTDIGKTFVTTALIAAARNAGQTARAVKPVASGFDPAAVADSDTGQLLEAQGLPLTVDEIERCSPWRFAAPLSPDMAAAKEGRAIDFAALVAWSQAVLAGPEQHVLIEGIGGVMVPLTERQTVLDWIAALDIPAVLVVGSYLGTISHTLTAFEMLRARAVEVAAIVISVSVESPVAVAETAATIRRFADCRVMVLPRLNARMAAAHLQQLLV